MALPTYNEQVQFEFLIGGLPAINVTASNTINANGFDFLIGGLPVLATSPGGTPPVTYNATQFFMLF